MKIFLFIVFLLFPLNVYSSDSVPSDDSFSLNFWFDVDSSNDVGYVPLVTLDDLNNITSMFIFERDISSLQPNQYILQIRTSNGAFVSYTVMLSDGSHMFSLSYGPDLDAHRRTLLYIDSVRQYNVYSSGVTNQFIGGEVILSSDVVPGSFFYSADILSVQQIQSVFDFSRPGTIKYQINLLFWEVIKHFRSFF